MGNCCKKAQQSWNIMQKVPKMKTKNIKLYEKATTGD